MLHKVTLFLIGILIGIAIGYFSFSFESIVIEKKAPQTTLLPSKKIVIGFLPYWLVSDASMDYSSYITQLAYFGLTISTDGSIQKMASDTETEPGWYALDSGKVAPMLDTAKKKNTKLSLVAFSGDNGAIDTMLENPEESANRLTTDVIPIMKQYGFTDLNLDVESTKDASEEARLRFTKFARVLKENLQKQKVGTLTLDVSPSVFIKNYLIDPKAIAPIADFVVIMGYDYHFTNSFVSGPVSPLGGVSSDAEFDIQTAVTNANKILSKNQIILGIPLYGYQWETIGKNPRMGVIPQTGTISSNKKTEELLSNCLSCIVQKDLSAKESYVIYPDTNSQTYHQIFYPDEWATEEKIAFTKQNHLGGIALWALGYEGKTILTPLKNYKTSIY